MYLLKCTRIDHFTVNGCCFVFSELFSSWADMIDFRLTLFYYFFETSIHTSVFLGSEKFWMGGGPLQYTVYLKATPKLTFTEIYQIIRNLCRQRFRSLNNASDKLSAFGLIYLSGFILLPISVNRGWRVFELEDILNILYHKSYGVSLGNYFFNGFN